MLGRLRGRRARALIAALVLVAVVAPIGIWRLADRSQTVVKVVIKELVYAHPPTGYPSPSECGPDRSSWWPQFDYGVAAWSPDGLEVYFTDQGDLQGVTSDGSQRWLIAKSVPGTFYAVAPDGMQLVYTDCRPETDTLPDGTKRVMSDQTGLELLLVRRGGGGVEQLTANVGDDFYPAWSPDGRRIAFLVDADAAGLGMGLNTMATDGTDVQRLLDEEFAVLPEPPQWSPDGRHLAVVRYFAHRRVGTGYFREFKQIDRELYVVGADGAKRWRLATDVVSGPSWSPDGQHVAYARANADGVALYTVRIDGRDETRIGDIPNWREPDRSASNPQAPEEAWIDSVAWSPDGTRILVRPHPEHPPFVIRLETGATTPLRIVGGRYFVNEVLAAAWSPNGRRIALVGRENAKSLGPDIVATVTADGTNVLVLAEKAESASWQPVQPKAAAAAACGAGVVVPEPDANPELVRDCVALVKFH